MHVGAISKRKSQKLHSWQCCKLIIPSFLVRVAIGASLYMVCLKHLEYFKIIRLRRPARKTTISYLEMKNGLQSVFWPFGPSTNTNNIKNIIFQSIFSLLWILRPTRWDRLWRQVQIMTNQTEFSRAELEQYFTSSLSSYLLSKYS